MPPVALTIEPFTAALLSAVALLLVVRALDVWEKEPLWVLGVMFAWGAAGATALSLVGNEAVGDILAGAASPQFNVVWTPAISAPIVEEVAKGLALVAALLIARWVAGRSRAIEFDGLTDGIVYGFAIGLGFAFAENNFYFVTRSEGDVALGAEILQLREGFLNLGLLLHGVFTASLGAGIGLATWSRGTLAKVGWPLLGLGVAMFLHAFNNGFTQLLLTREYGLEATARALAGEAIPADLAARMTETAGTAMLPIDLVRYGAPAVFVLAMLLWVRHQRAVLRFELAEEANAGLITREEWNLVARYVRRLAWYAQLLSKGRLEHWRAARRVHHQLAELAFLKWRLRRTGDADASDVERRREEIRWLREQHLRFHGAGPLGAPGESTPAA